ncbi:type II toxin-antitoxin system PemK/MazF family toxin [Motilibacter deserti]|uniref:Type II toxin-antitoxin system PemK/MazF family toxin n=1 Tax=Motilibacter deserti TaxID=2714956 RepID=A0ABX0GX52_9ACTN|nr:type II toxin-antitoxin system PemK/MazF family toxin [Motilibacter deserti]NHC15536.1 type II toxin-antitoxin system PemK/MazF family toxin [Motilibacter deserti]
MATSRYALLGRLLDRLVPRPGRARRAARPAAPSPARTSASTTTVPARKHAGRAVSYSPALDGRADPGEVVWAWVAYEDDPRRGKDRPVLVVGRQGSTVLGLMLSSQSERDGQRDWLGLGPGAWDREGRPSWVRLDRVLEMDERAIRREGAVLDRRRFDSVAAELRKDYGWR